MLLSIDTSKDIYKFGLYWNNFQKEFSALREDKKDALFYIAQFLRQNKFNVRDLKAIAVYNSKGSFTGVRMCVTIANALSFSLKIPVFGYKTKNPPFIKIISKIKKKKNKIGEYVKPVY